jgi:hypothetical protein
MMDNKLFEVNSKKQEEKKITKLNALAKIGTSLQMEAKYFSHYTMRCSNIGQNVVCCLEDFT